MHSALISKDSIKDFDEENWKSFKNKSSAPKFKSALVEARKMLRDFDSNISRTIDNFKTETKNSNLVIKKKRGRPRKLNLLEARRKLQQLFYSNGISHEDEISIILSRINNANELDQEEINSSKIGVLLKKVFCSEEFQTWQKNERILKLVKELAIKLINSN